ncbi:MAG: type II toxin-antitoxin system VapC family toxin [Chloroflexi bacterium]|nr:type II toxin-antitoxin system VapC family toxin [Chloroflexota bacterium]
MRPRFVLDAWAILAFLQGEEPAASRVRQLLRGAEEKRVDLFVSVVNLGEVVYHVGRARGEQEAWALLDEIRRLPLVIAPAADDRVFAAARLKMRYAISYADAFAAALAQELGATLVTGDPELESLRGEIPLEKLERVPR